jgi:hypothetical protein
VHFRAGSTITDAELEWAHELVTSNYQSSFYIFDAQGLMDDLCDPSSRFLLVTERATGEPVAFAHFRFTVEGEVQDAMVGEPVLLLRDLHVDPEIARKGLGKHLCQLSELIARKNAMRSMMVLVPVGEAGDIPKAFLTSKLHGFQCIDEHWKPAATNLSVFAKSLVKAPTKV